MRPCLKNNKKKIEKEEEKEGQDNDSFRVTHPSPGCGKVSDTGLTQKLPYEMTLDIQSVMVESWDS